MEKLKTEQSQIQLIFNVMSRENAFLRRELESIVRASESDNVSGASAISLMLEFWKQQKRSEHGKLETALVEILHESNGEELKTLSWLLSGMATNGILLRNAFAMLRGKLIELSVSNGEKSVIQQIEKDIYIISRFEKYHKKEQQ